MKLTRRDLLERWWMLPVAGTLGAFGFMGWYARRVTHKYKAGEPKFTDMKAQRVAALKDLGEEWAEVEFVYDNRPCLLLRVPREIDGGLSVNGQHFAAFSRICTHLGCPVSLVKDTEVLAFAFNYRPPREDRHPQLGCRCHFNVFDPLKAGESVFGKAKSPLPRVELELRGGDIYAVGIEPQPALGT